MCMYVYADKASYHLELKDMANHWLHHMATQGMNIYYPVVANYLKF
jgi:hypothetical protein